jgi:hypothetical protein
LGDTVRTGCPAPNGVDAVLPFRGPGGISSRTDRRHRRCGHPLLNFSTPFDVFIGERGRGSLGSPLPASVFALASVSPCSTSSRRRAPAPFRVPLPSVRGLSPFSRVLPETAAERFGRVACSLGPSHGVLLPTAVANAKGPFFSGRSHSLGTLRLQGFNPLDALSPLHAFQPFLAGPLLGFQPSGLLLLPVIRIVFRLSEPSWPLPDPTHER